MLLTTEPSGARLPSGKADGARHAEARRPLGREDDLVGVDAVALDQELAHARAPVAALPPVEHVAERAAVHREGIEPQQPESRRWSITSGTPPARNTRTVGWSTGPFGSTLTMRGTRAVDARPVLDGRPPEACRIRDRRDVQQQIGRAAEGRVDDHRVVQGVVGEDVLRADSRLRGPAGARAERRASSSQIGWPEGASAEWRSDEPERLGDHLRRRGRARGTGSRRRARRRPRSPARRPRSSVSSPWVKRAPIVCTLPACSPTLGGSVTPPGTSTPGDRPAPPAPASSPAGPCRRSRRPSLRGAWAASGSAAGTRSRRRCGRRGSPSSRACPACGRRTGR